MVGDIKNRSLLRIAAATKDLETIVQGLKDKINNLEAENDILEARVHELENV